LFGRKPDVRLSVPAESREGEPDEPTTRPYAFWKTLSANKYITEDLRKKAERAAPYEQRKNVELTKTVREKMAAQSIEQDLADFLNEQSNWTPDERIGLGYELVHLHDAAYHEAVEAKDEQYARWHWGAAIMIGDKLAEYHKQYGRASQAARPYTEGLFDTSFGAIQMQKKMNENLLDSALDEGIIKESIKIGNEENAPAIDAVWPKLNSASVLQRQSTDGLQLLETG